MDVFGPPGVVMIAPGIRTGLDGDEAVVALAVRDATSRPGEIGVQGRVVLIDLMDITPGGVALPNFDQRVGHRPAVLVGHFSTAERSPGKPLVLLPHSLSEITGPLYGQDSIGPNDHDLTRQHDGEPIGQRSAVDPYPG